MLRLHMTSLPSRDAILDLLAKNPGGLAAAELRAHFRLPATKHEALLRFLDSMTFQGQLEAKDGERFRIPRDEPKPKPAPRSKRPPEPVAERRGGKSARDAAPKRPRRESDEPAVEIGFQVAKDRPNEGPRDKVSIRPGSGPKKGLPPLGDPFSRKSGAKIPSPVAERTNEPRSNDRGRGKREEREGTLTVNPRGFGFLANGTGDGDDVFIPEEAMSGAMHGDKVRVQLTGRNQKGAEGVVIAVLGRGLERVGGILRRRGTSTWLEPDDPRIRSRIVLRGIDAHGTEGNSGEDGDLAVVFITQHPSELGENPEGKLIAVLGKPGELAGESARALLVAGIEETHSDLSVTEAESFGATVPLPMLAGRVDLTHIPLPTIDPEDARDHDDAVWVTRDGAGFRAWIAIADVSSYVTPGSALDAEALKRGCSVYLPDRAVPMLPRALSSNLCSLLPDEVRLCLCVEAEIDATGQVISTKLHRGFMKSAAKLTYGGVARALGFTEEPPKEPKAEAMVKDLRVAYELSLALRGRRMARGALDFNLPEPKIIWEDKKPVNVVRRSQDLGVKKAYQLIEELMLLANEVVAEWLSSRGIPTIFRVHLQPDEKKLARLAAYCEALGIPFDMEDATNPKRLAAMVKRFDSLEQSAILNGLLLRSMKQATYDTENHGHFGLASPAYLHFTSPIRRYPDLIVHRAVHSEILKERRKRPGSELGEAARQSSFAERRAMEVEREVLDLHRCFIMKDHIGERFMGRVSAIVGGGMFVTLDEPFVDVFVRFEDLGADSYEADELGLRVTAMRSGDTITVGDTIEVEVFDVQLSRRQISARRFGAPERTGDLRDRRGQSGGGGGRGQGGGPRQGNGKGKGANRGDGRDDRTKHGSGSKRDPRGIKAAAAATVREIRASKKKGKAAGKPSKASSGRPETARPSKKGNANKGRRR